MSFIFSQVNWQWMWRPKGVFSFLVKYWSLLLESNRSCSAVMARANQFSLLMWKNFILLKRAPVRTFFQIAMPLLFIAILVFLRAFKIKNEYKPNVTYPAFEVNKLPSDVSKLNQIAFAPNTSAVKEVINDTVKQLGFTHAEPFISEEDMVNYLVSLQGNEKTFLGGIVFNTSLNSSNIIYKIRLSSKTDIKQNGGKEERQGFGTSPSTTWNTQFTFPVLQVPGPRNKNASHGGPPFYFEAGFLAIQHAVDVAIMKYKGKIDILNTTVSVKRFPYPDYTHDNFVLVIQTSLPLLLMLSLIFTALNIVRDVVYEKEKKLKVRKFNFYFYWSLLITFEGSSSMTLSSSCAQI